MENAIEVDGNTPDSDLSAFEDIQPKKKAKMEVLKKKEKKSPANNKDCSFKIDKEAKEKLKLLEEAKREIEGRTLSQPQ
eukprot:1258449-Ditylum_brightwellii.AAC.1